MINLNTDIYLELSQRAGFIRGHFCLAKPIFSVPLNEDFFYEYSFEKYPALETHYLNNFEYDPSSKKYNSRKLFNDLMKPLINEKLNQDGIKKLFDYILERNQNILSPPKIKKNKNKQKEPKTIKIVIRAGFLSNSLNHIDTKHFKKLIDKGKFKNYKVQVDIHD